MNYLSVCSGIEAASVAWGPLGWAPVAFSEIEPFPCSVLAHHYPAVPNLGDMNNFKEWPDGAIDILCGGTPCQSFSVAGLRSGLDDPRGNLMLVYGAIAARHRPRWLVWENVPGVLSSNAGRDFGTFLAILAQCGYGFAYRVLDAQYFGVAQRRRRVFVVGYLGDWHRAAAVLFERQGLSRHPAPSRPARRETTTRSDGEPYAFDGQNLADCGDLSATLDTASTKQNRGMHVAYATQVRRLTPRECERLQGFPDDYTAVAHRGKPAADGPRYKALGNSWAVPVVRWIGERIAQVEAIA